MCPGRRLWPADKRGSRRSRFRRSRPRLGREPPALGVPPFPPLPPAAVLPRALRHRYHPEVDGACSLHAEVKAPSRAVE